MEITMTLAEITPYIYAIGIMFAAMFIKSAFAQKIPYKLSPKRLLISVGPIDSALQMLGGLLQFFSIDIAKLAEDF